VKKGWADYAEALDNLDEVPGRFQDNGCSMSPDSIFNTSIRWACRIHDYRYCSRAQEPGSMTDPQRKRADKELKRNLGLGLPWYSRWARWVYFTAVRLFGAGDHSFDSCDYHVGVLCRHNMPIPLWMKSLHEDTQRA
jgi:hypothetical protein